MEEGKVAAAFVENRGWLSSSLSLFSSSCSLGTQLRLGYTLLASHAKAQAIDGILSPQNPNLTHRFLGLPARLSYRTREPQLLPSCAGL